MWKWFLLSVCWVGLSYPVYKFLPSWCIVVYGVLTIGGALLLASKPWAKPKPPTTLNSFALLAGLWGVLTPEAATGLGLVLLAYGVIAYTLLTARRSTVGENWASPTWYRNLKFSLLPNLEFRRGNAHNTDSFCFCWLFLRVWSLDSVEFEVALVASSHFGFGVIGQLPYLRWMLTIPVPERWGMWVQQKLWRRPRKEQQTVSSYPSFSQW